MLKIPDKPRLTSEETAESKKHMRDLRGRGFTNREISQLCRGRWSEATVKKYTRGAEVKSTLEKDHVLEMITELTQAGKTIENIEDYQKFNNFLGKQKITLEALTKFYLDGITDGKDFTQFIRLNDELETSKRSLDQLNNDLDRTERLLDQGLSEENMQQILQTSKKYGGFEKTMQALYTYEDLQELNDLQIMAEKNFQLAKNTSMDLINKNNELETLNKVLGAYAATGQALMSSGYDLGSLSALRTLASKYGGPVALFDAMGEYHGIEELKQTRANLTETNRRLDETRISKEAELAACEGLIASANKMIGKIEENQGKALAAQVIIELMTDPESLEIEATRFKRITLHFLLGLRQYSERNKEEIDGWKTVEVLLKWLIDGLTKIT